MALKVDSVRQAVDAGEARNPTLLRLSEVDDSCAYSLGLHSAGFPHEPFSHRV